MNLQEAAEQLARSKKSNTDLTLRTTAWGAAAVMLGALTYVQGRRTMMQVRTMSYVPSLLNGAAAALAGIGTVVTGSYALSSGYAVQKRLLTESTAKQLQA